MDSHIFKPTHEEIEEAELALKTELQVLNKNRPNQSSPPIIYKNLQKYRRQYFGVINEHGGIILVINSFWSKRNHFSEKWLKEIIEVYYGCSYYWSVKFNLTEKPLFELDVNGCS